VPLREALDAFVRRNASQCDREVRKLLYKGNIIVRGRRSP
jgi:argininosuccinate synthase